MGIKEGRRIIMYSIDLNSDMEKALERRSWAAMKKSSNM